MRASGELSFISDLRARFPGRNRRGLHRGIGDDCALLRLREGWQIAVTTDLFLEGRHFRRDSHTPESAGHRCLARGLSDLAAMGGAAPLAAFLSLALPHDMLRSGKNRRWLEGFLQGFAALSHRFEVPLAGGDTGEAPGSEFLADIILVGQIKPDRALLRSGARPGDGIWVTGSLGGAAAELKSMLARAEAGRRARQTPGPQSFPEPRLAVGAALARRAGMVTACLDVSDGLSTDLAHLCEQSAVAARIEAARLPLHPLAVRRGPEQALALALHGGEDYELLFTARSEARLPKRLAGVPLTRIGTVSKQDKRLPRLTLVDDSGRLKTLTPGGWEHLR